MSLKGGAAEARPHFPELKEFQSFFAFRNASPVRCWRCGFFFQWLVEPPTLPTRHKRFSCISNHLQNTLVILFMIHNLHNLAHRISQKNTFSSFFCPPGPGDNISEWGDSTSALRHQQQQPRGPSHPVALVQGGSLRPQQGHGLSHLSDRCPHQQGHQDRPVVRANTRLGQWGAAG